MIRQIQLLGIATLIFLFSSCFRKDEQVQPHPPGSDHTDTIGMTSNYQYQVYYKLATASKVGQNLKTACDIGFDCSLSGWQVRLNTADFMFAADLGNLPFGQQQDTLHAPWKFDKSDGNPDSLAIGKWFIVQGQDTVSLHHVYVLNRGMDENGNKLGAIQLIMDSLKNGTYYFRYAKLNGLEMKSVAITKDTTFNYVWFSFPSGESVKTIEPRKTDYDLLFTQYTTLLFTSEGASEPYLVTGVLLNHAGVTAVLDSIHPFEIINLELARNLPLTNALDAIGYEWKALQSSYTYTIKLNYSYVIKDPEGYFYKLRFNSFYNNGVKGYPIIEFQAL